MISSYYSKYYFTFILILFSFIDSKHVNKKTEGCQIVTVFFSLLVIKIFSFNQYNKHFYEIQKNSNVSKMKSSVCKIQTKMSSLDLTNIKYDFILILNVYKHFSF